MQKFFDNRPHTPSFQPFPKNVPLPPALRHWRASLGLGEEKDPFARSEMLAKLEAVLFLTEDPVPLRRLTSLIGAKDGAEARRWLGHLGELYEQEGSAFRIEEIAGGFQLLTRSEVHPWLVRFHSSDLGLKLSGAAKETLAIVAYRQPIMRAEIEGIRGVQCSDVLRQLMEKNLIRIAGRHDSLGRPVLYGTTKKFLQALGLKQIRDLPRWSDLSRQ